MKYIFVTLIILVSCAAFGDSTNEIISNQKKYAEITVKKIIKENDKFEQYKIIANQNFEKHQIKNSQANGLIKSAPEAIIFVSFSMPTLSLKQIIQDAARYQVPVVIRGLYKNSFRATIEKIFDLVKEDNKGGVAINPIWFAKYNIKTVPAVVVSNNQEFDVVYGNIPLKRALSIIAERGDAAAVAEKILARSKT